MHARTIRSLVAAAAILPAASSLAQTNSFTISDGSATFSLDNLRVSRTASNSGTGSFSTGAPATNHMYQNWFWLSAGTDTREYALSNQTYASTLGTNAQVLEYLEPANNGAVPGALKVRLDYTLHDLATSAGRSDEALLIITFQITNRLPTQLANIQFYHYADFDAAGGSAGDSALIRGDNNQTQVISDAGTAAQLPARIDYSVSSAAHLGYQMGVYPTIRNLLTDSALSGLSSAGSPMVGSDYSGANQWWVLALGPAGGGQDTFTGSVSIHITTKCKADFNESGSLEVQDIFDFLGAWFAGCP